MSFFISSMQGFLSISDSISLLPPNNNKNKKKKTSMKKALVQSFGDHVFYLYVFCFLCHFYSRCPRHFNCGMEKTSGLEQCCRR